MTSGCLLRMYLRFDWHFLGLSGALHRGNGFCRRWSCHLGLSLGGHLEGLGDGVYIGVMTFCRST